mmetsp:Transcript_6364/g.11906  ORF Transcript_6364/g.11906 Transcript_6364/m.11906 type:complete len:127 (+) Transcript_6364:220-600(+)
MWISITGLNLKAFYHAPKFWYYTIPAMRDAKNAPGNILSEGNLIEGTHHTLSAWTDRESMLKYMRSSNHVAAMKILDDVATGKVYGYESSVVPSWAEARQLYVTKGRVVGAAARAEKKAGSHAAEM